MHTTELCYTFMEKGITTMALTISNKGWVVIPAEFRKKYALNPGTEVALVDYGGVLAIIPAVKDPIQHTAGMLKGGASLTKSLLAEHRKERQRGR
jgi:AbrB family looped-hinge helix DNA binding protein